LIVDARTLESYYSVAPFGVKQHRNLKRGSEKQMFISLFISPLISYRNEQSSLSVLEDTPSILSFIVIFDFFLHLHVRLI
jgi:hypothetical protein